MLLLEGKYKVTFMTVIVKTGIEKDMKMTEKLAKVVGERERERDTEEKGWVGCEGERSMVEAGAYFVASLGKHVILRLHLQSGTSDFLSSLVL